MLNVNQLVKLKEDDLSVNVKKEYLGTIVDILGNGRDYTIEFIDESGDSIDEALYKTYSEDELIIVNM